jgi:hypothetical protein
MDRAVVLVRAGASRREREVFASVEDVGFEELVVFYDGVGDVVAVGPGDASSLPDY